MPPAKNTPSKPEDEGTKTKADEEADLAAALARKTQDGKGEGDVPPSNFHSFATEGVEKTDLLSVEDVTSQVLAGRWGASEEVAGKNLHAAGYDVSAVAAEFSRRKAGGAPSAF